MPDPHKNFAVSSVATAPSPATSGTSLTLASGDGSLFPNPSTDGAFNVMICPASTQPTHVNAEIVRVTARSGDVLTIVRAQEGSSARSVGIGDLVALTITARVLQDVEPAMPVFKSGEYYYALQGIANTLGNGTPTQNRTYAMGPVPLQSGTLASVGIDVNGTGATSTVRLGLFGDTQGLPDALIADFGTVDTSVSTGIKEITISQVVAAGRYWFTFTQQGGTPPTVKCWASTNSTFYLPQGSTAPTGNPNGCVRDGNNWSGALGSTFGPYTPDNVFAPKIFFKYA